MEIKHSFTAYGK